MKVYVATNGEYSDFAIVGIFGTEELARDCPLADGYQEWDVLTEPIKVKSFYNLTWYVTSPEHTGPTLDHMTNPSLHTFTIREDNVLHAKCGHYWYNTERPVLTVHGTDLDRIMKVYGEQRAKFLAQREGL